MLSWSYNGGFFGNYLCVGKMVASIAQGTSPCAQSARRQRPCCRLFPPLYFFFQNEYVSYAGRSGRASVRSRRSAGRGSSSSRIRLAKSYGRFAPLNLRQDCFFRVYLPKATFLVQSACGGQLDSFRSSIHRETPFRQLPKAADASQPLGFDKPSSLRRLPILRILMYNNLMARGINEYKNGYDFYKDSETDQIWQVDNHGQEGPYLFSFDQKTVFNFWTDYPDKLTPEQIEIFKKENPTMAELK